LAKSARKIHSLIQYYSFPVNWDDRHLLARAMASAFSVARKYPRIGFCYGSNSAPNLSVLNTQLFYGTCKAVPITLNPERERIQRLRDAVGIFKPKITILVPRNRKCFVVISNILQPFVMLYGHLVYFVVIW
jgi:hypothetical protein